MAANDAATETDLENWSIRLDILLAVGVAFSFVVIGLYIRLILREKEFITYPSIQLNNLKIASIIPSFCIIAIFGICFPIIHGILEAVQALLEGICVYYFFKMIETYSLNYNEISVKDMLSNGPKHIIWDTCQKHHTLCCYKAMRISIRNFLIVRPFVVLIAGLQELFHWEKYIYTLFSILQLLILISAMVSLVRFYLSARNYITNLGAAKKIIVIKIYIFVLIVQNFIVKRYTEQKGGLNNSRYYSFLVIVESFVVALFFTSVFSQEILKSSKSEDSVKLSKSFLTEEEKGKEELLQLSDSFFVLAVLSPFGGADYSEEVRKLHSREKHIEFNSVMSLDTDT